MLLMVINGFFSPIYAAIFGFIWVTGRFIYGWGYANNGPKGRNVGSIISHGGDLPLLLMLVYSIYAGFKGSWFNKNSSKIRIF